MNDIANKSVQRTDWLHSNTYTPPQNDEIDLKELFFVLWNQKKLILVVTLLCLLASTLYVTTATKFWKTQAIITFPSYQDIGSLTAEVEKFKPFFDQDNKEELPTFSQREYSDVKSMSPLKVLASKELLFSKFLFQFNSTEHQLNFLQLHPDMIELIRYHRVDGRKVPKIEATMKKLKQNTGMISIPVAILTLQTTDPAKGEKFLRDYMMYVNDIVANKETMLSLKSLIAGRERELEQERLFLRQKASLALKDSIETTKKALDIARAAQINRPILMQQNAKQGDFLSSSIAMGSDVLQSKLDMLKGLLSPNILEPKIAEITALLQEMKKVKLKSINFQPYNYIEQAWSEDNYSHPKPLLIIVLSILLGGMLGCTIALIRHYMIGIKPELKEKTSY